MELSPGKRGYSQEISAYSRGKSDYKDDFITYNGKLYAYNVTQ